ncbi:MAG TPA: response regulator transcription factor [Candidatus Baltobacteraceae bacterium]|nr:response regulator transcription factor [Candidatus Baltobacteraceae bacterium]
MIETITPIRVLIVNKEVLLAKALAHVLAAEPGIKVAGTVAESGAVESIAAVDVIVVDVDAEPPDEVLARFKSNGETVKVCALSFHAQGELMEHCLVAGIDAYVVKSSPPQELLDAIRTIGGGQSYADPRVAALLLRDRPRSNRRVLSAREREVVRLVAQGLTNRQIGGRLILSEKTIKNHVSHILSKLHCKGRSQIAVAAIRIGLA